MKIFLIGVLKGIIMATGFVIAIPAMLIGVPVSLFNKQLGQNIGEFPWVMMMEPEELLNLNH